MGACEGLCGLEGLWGPVGACGGLGGPVRACGSLWRPVRASGDLWEPVGQPAQPLETCMASRHPLNPVFSHFPEPLVLNQLEIG